MVGNSGFSDFKSGQGLHADHLEQFSKDAIGVIEGGDGILVIRDGNRVVISLADNHNQMASPTKTKPPIQCDPLMYLAAGRN